MNKRLTGLIPVNNTADPRSIDAIMMVVDDPTGTPVSKKITIRQLAEMIINQAVKDARFVECPYCRQRNHFYREDCVFCGGRLEANPPDVAQAYSERTALDEAFPYPAWANRSEKQWREYRDAQIDVADAMLMRQSVSRAEKEYAAWNIEQQRRLANMNWVVPGGVYNHEDE